ncbi:hypothetical protein [Cloacibacillus evryensis]|uniref:hypothetical protein n=1 Tax=Cloacibacillus evryensis TaxID=508460 RepID=UPI00241E3EDA|nr:hypothetical protein [Cloacibacillus evryensis]
MKRVIFDFGDGEAAIFGTAGNPGMEGGFDTLHEACRAADSGVRVDAAALCLSGRDSQGAARMFSGKGAVSREDEASLIVSLLAAFASEAEDFRAAVLSVADEAIYACPERPEGRAPRGGIVLPGAADLRYGKAGSGGDA